MSQRVVFTIGHSTRKFEDFVTMLLSFGIEVLADVRAYPGSRWFPQFNKERMRAELEKHNIVYVHFKELGGRKDTDGKPTDKRSKKQSAFGGYAAYMKTEPYKQAEAELLKLATEKRTAYMCAEADWHKCHRSLISDSFKQQGWNVQHITGVEQSEPHVYTEYVDANGKLF